MNNRIFNEQFIQWVGDTYHWQDAIRKSTQPLLEQNRIMNNYIDSMIENVMELGPYILIAPNVALPHSRPESGVKEAGVSLTVFETPVQFKKKQEYHAQIFICLAATTSETHLSLLKTISSWIENKDLMTTVASADGKNELLQLFAPYYF
ncbi:PTS sugar transporter subunit IIA [Evansella halocellulosilytica]|uniref:PTS sugar transporter subunit IIA n=1 Tax=Evansella halocellulosilytica TaxID=2011013 RepID=UPI000BB82D1E|nr:PTS sugar transporter subunit IIA [Evansella halocellulosilytica]